MTKRGPRHIQASQIKIRPFTFVKLSKRLQPLPGLSGLILQIQGSKEFVVYIGPRDVPHIGIRIVGGDHLFLPVGEGGFKELYLYSSIDHPDFRLNFDLRGKAFRDHRKEHDRITEEATKSMWIYLTILQFPIPTPLPLP